jgi:hypothetical protein
MALGRALSEEDLHAFQKNCKKSDGLVWHPAPTRGTVGMCLPANELARNKKYTLDNKDYNVYMSGPNTSRGVFSLNRSKCKEAKGKWVPGKRGQHAGYCEGPRMIVEYNIAGSYTSPPRKPRVKTQTTPRKPRVKTQASPRRPRKPRAPKSPVAEEGKSRKVRALRNISPEFIPDEWDEDSPRNSPRNSASRKRGSAVVGLI